MQVRLNKSNTKKVKKIAKREFSTPPRVVNKIIANYQDPAK